MTIKVGTRVRVSYEATVRQIVGGGGTYYVPPEEKLLGEASAWWLHPSRFEVIPEPLRVGDVITADTTEPPIGTLIKTTLPTGETFAAFHANSNTWTIAAGQRDVGLVNPDPIMGARRSALRRRPAVRPLRRREPQPEPAGCPCPTCRSDWYIRDDHFALWMRVHGAHDPETAPYDWQKDGL